MRKVQHAPYLRPLAWFTFLALGAALVVVPAVPARAAGSAPQATVAVVQVVNQSGSSVQNLANRFASALTHQLSASGQYKVLGQQAVDAAIEAAGVTLPLRRDVRDQQLGQIAGALRADYLVVATIDSVEVDAARQLAAVKSRVDWYGRLAQGDLTCLEVTAFNLDRTNNEATLVDDALEQNALYAVREVGSNLGTVGRVLTPPLEDSVRITLRESDSLRAGAQFVVLRNGVRYGLLELRSISAGQAECWLVQRDKPDYGLSVNDSVVLYKQGQGGSTSHSADWDSGRDVPTGVERARRNSNTLFAIIGGVALLGLGIWAVAQGKSNRDEARTASLVSPPNNAVITVTAGNVLSAPLSFTATSVNSADQMTLQVATDPGFTTIAYTQTKEGTATGGTSTSTQEGTQPPEPRTTVIFTPAAGTAFLPPGTYYWRVVTVSSQDTHVSNTFALTIVREGISGSFLRSPDTVTALPGSGYVELQWSPVAGAAGYEVWRRILTPRFANEVGRGRTFRPETGASAWLRDTERRSPRVARSSRRSALTGGAVVPQGGRQDTGASLAGFSRVAEAASTALSYTDTSVSNGTEYQWVILTKDIAGTVTGLGDAQASSFVATTPLGAAPPATPTNLAALAGDGQVVLSWSANTETDLAGYQVFRATAANGNFVDITNNLVVDPQSPAGQGLSAGPGDVTVTDRNLTNGVEVFYRIRALQLSTVVNGTVRGGLESPLSGAVNATPSSAPPQELQVVQPPNNSTVDADRPQLAWRGVTGASEYTVQISSSPSFPAAGLITTTTTEPEVIYPASLPALVVGTQYYLRVGIFDPAQQALRFGPTSTFVRGAVQRFTTTVSTTLGGAAVNGARLSLDGADTGEVTPAQFILAAKAGTAAYSFIATFDSPDGTRYTGTASYRPGIDSATVVIPLAAIGVAPPPPTGLTATGQTDRIVLRWNPDPNLVAGGVTASVYSVRRRSNTEEGAFTEVARLNAPAVDNNGSAPQLFHTDFNVRQGVRYYYQIVGISAAGVESLPSVSTNAVAGVGAIQVITPQDNQTFLSTIAAQSWSSSIDFAWIKVPAAVRYVFEIGLDPDLHQLLENGNAIIAQSDQPSTTVNLGDAAPASYEWFDDGDLNTVPLYWRVIAVDEDNVILNQTEARRLYVNQPGLREQAD